MSQVFSADSVNTTGGTTVITTAETTAIVGNFVSPPFGNAKAIVVGQVTLTVGTGTTTAALRIRRNPNGENLLLGGTGLLTVTAGNVVSFSASFADVIPDGRAVQYAVTVVQTGATGNGTINGGNVTVFLISG